MEGVVIAEKSYIFHQQQNAMGSLRAIDFGVLWASSAISGKEPGSGKFSMGEVLQRFQVPEIAFPRFGQLLLF